MRFWRVWIPNSYMSGLQIIVADSEWRAALKWAQDNYDDDYADDHMRLYVEDMKTEELTKLVVKRHRTTHYTIES